MTEPTDPQTQEQRDARKALTDELYSEYRKSAPDWQRVKLLLQALGWDMNEGYQLQFPAGVAFAERPVWVTFAPEIAEVRILNTAGNSIINHE